MVKVFLDANVVIDFLCEREGFYLPAAKLVVKGFNKEIKLFCSSLSLATASYFMGKGNATKEEITQKISDFLTVCSVTPVDENIVRASLSSDFSDFEDALQYFSAKQCDIEAIITRNKKDFKTSEIPVLLPTEDLELTLEESKRLLLEKVHQHYPPKD